MKRKKAISASAAHWITGLEVSPLKGRRFVLGPSYSEAIREDPLSLSWTFSRYKFAARMFANMAPIVEIGCGEGIGAPMFAGNAGRYLGIDVCERQVTENRKRYSGFANIQFRSLDLCASPVPKSLKSSAQGVFMLDVLEHIHPTEERVFLERVSSIVQTDGVLIVGVPSAESSAYASKRSKKSHINLKSQNETKSSLIAFFKNVFCFSMNDEVVHTGFAKMAHYNLFVACNKRIRPR